MVFIWLPCRLELYGFARRCPINSANADSVHLSSAAFSSAFLEKAKALHFLKVESQTTSFNLSNPHHDGARRQKTSKQKKRQSLINEKGFSARRIILRCHLIKFEKAFRTHFVSYFTPLQRKKNPRGMSKNWK